MKKSSDLIGLSLVELQNKLLELRKEQFQLRMKQANGVLDKPHLMRIVRRSIARVKTMMTEKARESHVGE